jgi:anti-repressor protein
MTTEIQPFEFPATGQQVRTVVIDGEPWFVARDVAGVLGYSNGSRDIARHTSERQRREYRIGTPSGEQTAVVLSEPGVYRMVMRSNMPKAVEFQDWLAEDVIPSIRQTGRYEAAQPAFVMPTHAEALRGWASEIEAREVAEAQVAVLEPRAQAWDTLASAEGDFSVRDAAKILSRDPLVRLGERRLFTLLGSWGWLYRQQTDRRWRVMQTAVEAGRLSEIPASHYHPRSGDLVLDPPQVRVTAKGLLDPHRRLGGKGPLPIEQPLALGP